MGDPWNERWTAPDRQEAQWAEHRRLEAVVAAVKRGQRGITLRPFEPAGASPPVPEVGDGLQVVAPALEPVDAASATQRAAAFPSPPAGGAR